MLVTNLKICCRSACRCPHTWPSSGTAMITWRRHVFIINYHIAGFWVYYETDDINIDFMTGLTLPHQNPVLEPVAILRSQSISFSQRIVIEISRVSGQVTYQQLIAPSQSTGVGWHSFVSRHNSNNNDNITDAAHYWCWVASQYKCKLDGNSLALTATYSQKKGCYTPDFQSFVHNAHFMVNAGYCTHFFQNLVLANRSVVIVIKFVICGDILLKSLLLADIEHNVIIQWHSFKLRPIVLICARVWLMVILHEFPI